MYKNLVSFNVDPIKSKDALKKIIWQDQCLVSELFTKYLPNNISEMIPVDGAYEISWDTEESYNSFINEDLYKRISDILETHGVTFTFSVRTS